MPQLLRYVCWRSARRRGDGGSYESCDMSDKYAIQCECVRGDTFTELQCVVSYRDDCTGSATVPRYLPSLSQSHQITENVFIATTPIKWFESLLMNNYCKKILLSYLFAHCYYLSIYLIK